MKTILFLFWRSSAPFFLLAAGLSGLFIIPLLPQLPENMQYVMGIAFLFPCLMAGMFPWIGCWDFGLDLPLNRRRLFDLRVVSGFLASLPGVLLVLAGYWLRPELDLDLVLTLLTASLVTALAAVFCVALTPLFDAWHLLPAFCVALLVLGLHLGLFASLILEPSLLWVPGCVSVVLLPIVYIGGRWWFARWEPGVGGHIDFEKLPGLGRRALTRFFAILSWGGNRISSWIDNWNPARRFVLRGLYLSWSFLFFLSAVAAGTAVFVGFSLSGSVSMTGFWVLVGMANAGSFCMLVKLRLQLFMPLRRERLFDAFTLPLVAVYAVVAIGFVVNRHVAIHGTLFHQDHSWEWALEKPSEEGHRIVTKESSGLLSENFSRNFAVRFGVSPDARDVAKHLLKTGRIEPSAYSGDARSALWKQASVFFGTGVLLLFLAMAIALPRGPKRDLGTRPRLKQCFAGLFLLVFVVVMLSFPYLAVYQAEAFLNPEEIVQLGTRLLDRQFEAHIRLFAADYAPVLFPLLLLGCVALYVRNRRAFRMQESVTNAQTA